MELRFVPSESTFDYFYFARRYLERLSTVLRLTREQQNENPPFQRSGSAPKRRGQRQVALARKLNMAVLE